MVGGQGRRLHSTLAGSRQSLRACGLQCVYSCKLGLLERLAQSFTRQLCSRASLEVGDQVRCVWWEVLPSLAGAASDLRLLLHALRNEQEAQMLVARSGLPDSFAGGVEVYFWLVRSFAVSSLS